MEKNKIEFLKKYLEVEIINQENKEKNEEIYFNGKSLENFFREGNYLVINNKRAIIHIVKPNENIEIISKKYNKTEEEILLKNKVFKIFIGQQLLI